MEIYIQIERGNIWKMDTKYNREKWKRYEIWNGGGFDMVINLWSWEKLEGGWSLIVGLVNVLHLTPCS